MLECKRWRWLIRSFVRSLYLIHLQWFANNRILAVLESSCIIGVPGLVGSRTFYVYDRTRRRAMAASALVAGLSTGLVDNCWRSGEGLEGQVASGHPVPPYPHIPVAPCVTGAACFALHAKQHLYVGWRPAAP